MLNPYNEFAIISVCALQLLEHSATNTGIFHLICIRMEENTEGNRYEEKQIYSYIH